MKHIGVIFSEPMVLAILSGRKNQTRRLRGLERINSRPSGDWRYDGLNVHGDHLFFDVIGAVSGHDPQECVVVIKCPFGAAGDELWVRETWGVHKAFESWWNDGNRDLGPMLIIHKAGYPSPPVDRWRSPLHLFERYSRIRRPIVSVRPERLQDITEEDAIAEGIESRKSGFRTMFRDYSGPDPVFGTSSITSYSSLWNHLNGKKSPWSKNDWVWRIEFERVK